MTTFSDEKKKEFENKFSSLVKEHADKYKGDHPIFSWNSDSKKPEINSAFFSLLPLNMQQDIELLLAQIAG